MPPTIHLHPDQTTRPWRPRRAAPRNADRRHADGIGLGRRDRLQGLHAGLIDSRAYTPTGSSLDALHADGIESSSYTPTGSSPGPRRADRAGIGLGRRHRAWMRSTPPGSTPGPPRRRDRLQGLHAGLIEPGCAPRHRDRLQLLHADGIEPGCAPPRRDRAWPPGSTPGPNRVQAHHGLIEPGSALADGIDSRATTPTGSTPGPPRRRDRLQAHHADGIESRAYTPTGSGLADGIGLGRRDRLHAHHGPPGSAPGPTRRADRPWPTASTPRPPGSSPGPPGRVQAHHGHRHQLHAVHAGLIEPGCAPRRSRRADRPWMRSTPFTPG